MEFLIELVLELLLEGGEEICAHKTISKWIRYPVAIILILFYCIVIFGIMFLGIFALKENAFIGIFFIAVSIILLIGSLIKFKKVYLQRERND